MKKVKIGDCILLHGDCLELMPKLPPARIDLILCDLPYGTTECSWDTILPWDILWDNYHRLTQKRSPVVLTSSQPFTTSMIASNMKEFRGCWVWSKSNATGFALAKDRPLKQHEDIAIFSRAKSYYYPQGLRKCDKTMVNSARPRGDFYSKSTEGTIYVQEFTNYPKSIIHFAQDHDRVHQTQKPVKLMEYLIKTYSLGDQRVLDNCMGSGTTGVACINTGRKFIGMEQTKEYFDISCDRMNDAHKALLYKGRLRSLFQRSK
jgi:site-specific DNA-methyltransferase (adenine-specific)